MIIGIGAIMELIGEGWWQVLTMLMMFKIRVAVESLALFAKCITTYALLVYTSVCSIGPNSNFDSSNEITHH